MNGPRMLPLSSPAEAEISFRGEERQDHFPSLDIILEKRGFLPFGAEEVKSRQKRTSNRATAYYSVDCAKRLVS